MLPELNFYLLLLQKFFFVLGAVLYMIFAFVIVKQVGMMTKNVNDKFNPILITFAYLHLGFSALLIILTLVVL